MDQKTRSQDGQQKNASKNESTLEDKSLALALLVTTELEVLATLEGELLLVLADGALKTEDNLLGGLGLLVEDGLGLTTITRLLAVITTLALGEDGGLAGLVLGNLVEGVLLALLALAEGLAGLRHVHLLSARARRRGEESVWCRERREGGGKTKKCLE